MANRQLVHADHKTSALQYPLCFLAHDIDVPMNIGSFFRIADALGVEKIYLTGRSVTPPNPKIRKISRSAEKYVPYAYASDPLAVVETLRAAGYTIISLEITSTSISVDTLEVGNNEKICLILGSENEGISQALLDQSDVTVHIPMMGINSSMNVANACSIAAYDIIRRLK